MKKYNQLRQVGQEYIDYVKSEDLNEDYLEKYNHELHEKTMIFLFGPEIFDFIDNRLEESWENAQKGILK